MTWQNWAGNQRTDPVRTVVARDAGEIADAVKAAARDGLRVKALGSGHSFTAIGVADGAALVSPADPRAVRVDPATRQVTVPAGITLRALNPLLWEHGLALPNLGDIDAQTVAGAIATSTHGTGAGYQSIAAQVRALDIVLADGSIVHCSPTEQPELFSAARVGLGALGIIVSVTLQAVPAFRLRAQADVLPLGEVLGDLASYVSDNEHFEFYWFPHTDVAAVLRNNRTEAAGPVRGRATRLISDELVGNGGFGLACRIGAAAPRLVPRINRFLASQLGAGEFVARSYEVFCSPRRVRFVEMEYAVPRAVVQEAIAGLRAVAQRHGQAVTFPVEVRFLGADDIPLSTASGRDTVYIAVHVVRGQPYESYFAAVESVMTGLEGRPHWGKLHNRTAEQLRGVYPGFADFVALRDRLDPERRFTNPYLERVLG